MKTIKREHLKTKFSSDHVLKEAEQIINPAASQDEQYGQYYKVAKMLMSYEPRVRPLAIQAICQKFNLDISRLEKHVKGEEFDEDAERKMLADQGFTLSQYLDLVIKDKNDRRVAALIHDRKWSDYNGQTYNDPNTILLTCLYDMMRHIMWKTTTNQHDISAIAYIEQGWEAAMDELQRRECKGKVAHRNQG